MAYIWLCMIGKALVGIIMHKNCVIKEKGCTTPRPPTHAPRSEHSHFGNRRLDRSPGRLQSPYLNSSSNSKKTQPAIANELGMSILMGLRAHLSGTHYPVATEMIKRSRCQSETITMSLWNPEHAISNLKYGGLCINALVYWFNYNYSKRYSNTKFHQPIVL